MEKDYFDGKFDLNREFDLERKFDLSRKFYQGFSLGKNKESETSNEIEINKVTEQLSENNKKTNMQD